MVKDNYHITLKIIFHLLLLFKDSYEIKLIHISTKFKDIQLKDHIKMNKKSFEIKTNYLNAKKKAQILEGKYNFLEYCKKKSKKILKIFLINYKKF